jgi:hypothetical protein
MRVVALLAALLLSTAQPAGAAAEVQVAPTSTPGLFDFVATGFKANEMVSTWLTGPHQQVVPTDRHKVDHRGGIAFSLRLKRHLEPGRWAITVGGWESGREAIAYFDLPPRPPDIALIINPPAGAAGTTFAAAAAGFAEGERVSYWLTDPDGQAIDGDALEAGRRGEISFSWSTTAQTKRGVWWVSAYGQRSDRLGVASFSVD